MRFRLDFDRWNLSNLDSTEYLILGIPMREFNYPHLIVTRDI